MQKSAKPQEAVLKLKRVYFDEISYKFHAKDNANFEYEFYFEKAIEETSENCYTIFLKCNASDIENEVHLQIEVVGEFECEIEDEKLRESLLNENAIAILFPFLRSQICLVTTQPNSYPINLPAMNVLALFEE